MADEAQWIWSPEHEKGQVPQGACHFRKQFMVPAPEGGEIAITADDEYELYVNGRRVGAAQTAKRLDKYDISQQLTRGRNVIAIKVSNTQGGTAGVAARVRVRDQGRGALEFNTDASWVTNLRPLPFWHSPLYNDSRWAGAKPFGRLVVYGSEDRQENDSQALAVNTSPVSEPSAARVRQSNSKPAATSADKPQPGGSVPEPAETSQAEPTQPDSPATPEQQVKINPDFEIERLLDGDATGSLIAMAFNEFGHIVAAREGGELILIHDSDRNGDIDKVRVYCDKVKNCQGLVCLNGEVFVTGEGPDGLGLYRLSDSKRNGRLEEVQTLLKFRGKGGDHGAHALALGMDGSLYVSVGSQAAADAPIADQSPYRGYYEGDLVQPRLEGQGNHETASAAPCGVILRTNLKGETVQLLAGGLRNAYHLAFNAEGELFTHDSDAEHDEGLPWYRPSRICHVVPGAEFGFRTGWAKWPEYYADSLPSVLSTGRGAPTSVVFYDHYLFPERFRDNLFVSDWARGRILAVKLKAAGASYTATSELFFEAGSFHITGMDVGPDGWLYLVTGGRGNPGGLYRIRWTGKPDAAALSLGRGLSAVIRQPQLHSAWARQQVAAARSQIGADWDRLLRGVAISSANPWRYRTRALELMQLYGPALDADLLVQLSKAEAEQVRAKAAELMGLHGNADTRAALLRLLEDNQASVRRRACEALVRADQTAPWDKLTKLLKSDDRFEVCAARRLLERLPTEHWRDAVLRSDDPRLVVHGGLALLSVEPDKESAVKAIERCATLMQGFLNDRDFTDLLRLIEVAILRGTVTGDEVPRLAEALAEEYPSGNAAINRELVRLLVHLKVPSVLDRYLGQLRAENVSEDDKLHLALHAPLSAGGWSTTQRIELLEFFEMAQKRSGGHSYEYYVMNASREVAKGMSEQEARMILAEGTRWPTAAVGALYKLPQKLDDGLRTSLRTLDEQLRDSNDLAHMRLKVGIVAVLARSGDPQSQEYLRQLWRTDPERRPAVAMGLAQWPNEENWEYLVRSLPFLDGDAAREVLVKLRSVRLAPEEAEYFRHVILRGLRLEAKGAEEAVALLEFWTSEEPAASGTDWQAKLAAWQQWYAQKWPDEPEAVLPESRERSKWKLGEVLRHLSSTEMTRGAAVRGAKIFEKAQCAVCHRFGDTGDPAGQDLTSIARQRMRKEILESILYPSAFVREEYAGKTIITMDGRQYAGSVVSDTSGGAIIRQADGQQVIIGKEDIEEILPHRASDMPAGLLDGLSLQELTDLFAFLGSRPGETLTQRQEGSVHR
jgi:putative heme-binding domain-containing protein